MRMVHLQRRPRRPQPSADGRRVHELARIGRYANHPNRIPWAGWQQILSRTLATIIDVDTSLRCAGSAFFSFLSIFPAVACLVLIYGLVATPASLNDQLEVMGPVIPQWLYVVIQQRLQDLLNQREVGLGIGLIVSFAIALWSGSRGISSLISTISAVYHEKDNRSIVVSTLLSVGLTLAGMVIAIVIFFAVAAVPIATSALPLSPVAELAADLIRWPLLAVLVSLAISVLFRVAPHRTSAKWKWITPGAVIATLLWLILSAGFSLYLERFSDFGAMFGSLSVAVATMLWIYYSAMVVALGASLNAEIEYQTKIDTTVGPYAPMGQRGAFVADNLPEQSA